VSGRLVVPMKRTLPLIVWGLALAMVATTVAVASQGNPAGHLVAAKALLAKALTEFEPGAPTGSTGFGSTGSEPTGATPVPEPTLPTADLQPQRDPSVSASEAYFEIDLLNFDLPEPDRVLLRHRFETGEGWEFFDRWHYSCATVYLQAGGERVAQVVYRTAEGVAYAGINDRFGNEQGEGSSRGLSRCALPQGSGTGPESEIEEKPGELQDSVVAFIVDGVTVTRFICPATSSRDADTWCEFEEDETGPNHVIVEAYWQEDLVVQIDIDRMSPSVRMVASST
jgi:hypothetical protein